jgi:cyclopropane fatty-acyl-phospholipid synthase-like methyltransferase
LSRDYSAIKKITAFWGCLRLNIFIFNFMFVRDVPFVPSSWERLDSMVELADAKPGEKSIDLGSGDGRVVIALAKLGVMAFGYEVDPELVKKALNNIKEANLDGNAFIICTNYWEENLSEYDLITIYGITSIMPRLEEKLKKELKPGARVVSNFFTFPSWDPAVEKGDVYVYQQR